MKLIIYLITLFIIFFPNYIATAQWTQINGFQNNGVGALAVNGLSIYARFNGSTGGLFRSDNNGENWIKADTGITGKPGSVPRINVFKFIDTIILAGTYNGLFRSTNNGASWTSIDSGLTNNNVLSFASNGTHIFAGTAYGHVFLSTDYGTSWTDVKSDSMIDDVTCLTVVGSNLIAGTKGRGVFLSTNNGSSWNSIDYRKIEMHAMKLAIMPDTLGNPILLLVTLFDFVYLSSDSGAHWTEVHHLDLNSLLGIQDIAVYGSTIFAGTQYNGVLRSNDYGSTWNKVNTSLGDTCVNAIVICGSNLFVGTDSSGIWLRPLSDMVTSVDRKEVILIPKQFILRQNFPNPFNPSTNISFTIPVRDLVSLKVYDLLGREVKTLISGNMDAGTYSSEWNAANMASGIYYFRLQVGALVKTKKLVLLK